MKTILLSLITLYQVILVPILKQLLGIREICRSTPSCSQYTRQTIKKYGIIKGMRLGIIRIANCHPYGKHPK